MVALPAVRASNTALVQSQPLVAVFVGGTSGIGEYTIRALAATHGDQGKGLRIYIVGRNAAAAEQTIAYCRSVCSQGQFLFVKANDLSLLKDVDRVCAEIVRLEEKEVASNGGKPSLDLLVMSQAYFPLLFQPRKETPEGLDTNLSLLYYSRMRFAHNLLPLLRASPLPTGAHIISIYAAGKEAAFHPSDLSLRDPKHYNISTLRSHVCYMKTLFFENLASHHKLSCVHVFPGLVMTEAFNDKHLPRWFRILWWVVGPLAGWFSTPPREIGERVFFLATERYPAKGIREGDGGSAGIARGTDGEVGSGAYAVNWDGETVANEKAYEKVRKEGWYEKVWKHTMSAFGEIDAGRVFAG